VRYLGLPLGTGKKMQELVVSWTALASSIDPFFQLLQAVEANVLLNVLSVASGNIEGALGLVRSLPAGGPP
jgi:hypothetical protein